jgi:opacity protein-like surface antigen
MIRRAVLTMLVTLILAAPAFAQDQKVTVGASVGWTFSDGVSGDTVTGPNGNMYNAIQPKDGVSFNFSVGFLATPQAEVGFMFGRQQSTLQATGTSDIDVGDLAISSYHGYFAYNFGEPEATLRPYIMGGLGMTDYSDVESTLAGGNTIPGPSRFSTTWGAGVKAYPSPNAGVQFGVRWTPTYIKSDAAGWWCDPWFGCYLVGDPQYSNQFEFNGGVTFRF